MFPITAKFALSAWSALLALQLLLASSYAFPYPAASSGSSSRPRLKEFQFGPSLIDGKSVRVFCNLYDLTGTAVSFQWLKDGVPISTAASPHISIANFADYSSLAINRVDRRRDNGNYTCRAHNSAGTDQFSSVLNVQEPPVFEEKPTDVSIGLGQSKVIICRASTSYTVPEIRWNRILTGITSTGLAIGKDARREHIATGEQLHLTDVREGNAGVYECVADPHNDLAISHTFTVTVNVPASFESKSDLLEVKRGETAKLVCEAHGAKPVTIQWLRQNVRTGKFEVLNLDYVPDSFTYPRYTAIEKNFENGGSSSSNFVNGHKVHGHHSNNHYVKNNRTLFELHINSVNSNDNGRYECHVRNGFGEDRRRIDLFVQDVPAAVRDLHINSIWSRDVLITWLSPEAIGNSPIVQYVVQYWKEVVKTDGNGSHNGQQTIASSSGGHRLHEIEVSPTETQATIKKLTPGTAYVIRVIAVNNFGRGPPSAQVRLITQEEAPDGAPIDITAEPLGTSTLRIRWKAPPKGQWNGQLNGYYLGYRLVNSAAADNGDNSAVAGVSAADPSPNEISVPYAYKEVPFNGAQSDGYQEEYVLSGLNRASTYSIIIKSFNAIGEGPRSQEMVVTTSTNDPPPAPTLWAVETKENSVLLKWEQEPSASPVTHYVFRYREEKKSTWQELSYVPVTTADQQTDEKSSSSAANTYELPGLYRGTVYQIYMRSVAEKSVPSEPSETITVRTEGEAVPLVSLDSSGSQVAYPVAPFPTINSQSVATTHHLQLSPSPTSYTTYGGSAQTAAPVPPYLRLAFVIPVMIAAVIIVIACVSAYVYIRVDDRKAQMRAYKAAAAANGIYAGTVAVAPGKRFQFVSAGSGAGGGGGAAGPSGFNSSFNSTASFNLGNSSGGNKHDLSTQSLVSEEGSLSFRYSDSCSDKSRPLLSSRPPGMLPTGVLWAQQQTPIMEEDEAIVEIGSSAYETLPYEKNLGLSSSTPMSSFHNQAGKSVQQLNNTTNSNHSSNSGKSAKSPAFPPPPPPLPGAAAVGGGGFSGRSPLNKAMGGNSNMFCHVDVHHVQSSNASEANNSDSYDEFHFFSPGPQHV